MGSTDPDRNARTFSLYISADVEPQEVIAKIRGDDGTGEDDDYEVVSVAGLTTQQICQRHREHAVDGGGLYTTLFLVADSKDLDTRGVLVVNLKPYHGYPDAVRLEPEDAGNTIASLSIANTSWFELRESTGEKTALVPGHYFTLYNLLGMDKENDFEQAVKTLNDGVHDIVPEGEDNPIEYDVPGPPYGVARQYHQGAKPGDEDVDKTAQAHPSQAESQGRDPDHFAVADIQFDAEGPLFVKVRPRDSFRCKNPAAGEILGWIYINFMTWEEAKDFASKQA